MGSGVLHTKMWIVDQKNVYIGSANMDWRSLTEVKVVIKSISRGQGPTRISLGAGCAAQKLLLHCVRRIENILDILALG